MENGTGNWRREAFVTNHSTDLASLVFPVTALPTTHITEWNTTTNSTTSGVGKLLLPSVPITLTDTQQRLLDALGVFSIAICVIGIICNALSMAILARRQMRSTTSTFLVALSAADMVVLITVTLMCSLGSMINWNIGVLVDIPLLTHVYPFLRPAALTAIFISVWLTVALTADRYLAVCHALRTDRLFTVPRARGVTAGIVALSVIYNIPTCFEFTVVRHVNPALNHTQVLYVLTEFGANQTYRQVYHSWVLVPIIWGIPFVSLAYMNARLSVAVHRSKQRSRELGYPLTRGLDTTAMLVAVVVTFLLFQSPHMVATIIWSIDPTLYQNVSYLFFYYVAVILLLVNSSLNFFVYTVFSRRFRRQLVKVLCSGPCVPASLKARYQARKRTNSCYDTSQLEYRKKSSVAGFVGNKVDVRACETDTHQPLINSQKGSGKTDLFNNVSHGKRNTPLLTDSV